jgi:hypothetical protein
MPPARWSHIDHLPYFLSPNGDCDTILPSSKVASIELHQAAMDVEPK